MLFSLGLKAQSPVYVLVHGAWHGGWCWQKVSTSLQAQGANVYTPTLSGLGEHRHTLDSSVNLETHITDIVNFIVMQDLHNVILVGHSYAGTVIAGVADRIPERLSKLVFFDAMIVRSGQSALNVQPKENQVIAAKAAAATNGLSVAAWGADVFGVRDTADIRWVNERLTPQPYRAFTQTLQLKHDFGNHIPLIYVACVKPMLVPIRKFSEEAKKGKEWQYFTLNSGHDAMVSDPEDVAKLFTSFAK